MNTFFSKLSLSMLVFFVLFLGFGKNGLASEEAVHLDKAPIDLNDFASLQRGATLFMNECSGCHGLKFLRYNTMAKDIGIVDAEGKVLEQAVKDNLMFVGDKITDNIITSMKKADGANWFGVAPPDLSLVARSRGVDWIYSYLRAFTLDSKRPWGVNNTVFPDVAMPDVLYHFRTQLLSEKEGQQKYDRAILDLVNFLAYAAEPMQNVRKKVGIWVLLFLGVFFVFAYLLKREYWKDVH